MTNRPVGGRPFARLRAAAVLACGLGLMAPAHGVAAADPPLAFQVREGRQINAFLRQGPVAAHLVLDGGADPRMIVAFPAGNSGVGLWFAAPDTAAWTLAADPVPVGRAVEGGGMLHGMTAELGIDVPRLTVRDSVLGSVRTLRNFQYTGRSPADVAATPTVRDDGVEWRRRRLDGAAGYLLAVEVLNGTVGGGPDGPVVFTRQGAGPLRLRVTALTGDPPLTPVPVGDLLTGAAADDARARDVLAFLSYEEKLLAGSWRFNTYFGRDTLMSLRLLMPVVTPAVVEAGLGSVLDRLNSAGEVAHEEDIGEFAILRRRAEGGPGAVTGDGAGDAPDTPIHDYKMIDDDFMLAPVVAHYLLDTPQGRARAGAFLARTTPSGESYRDALLRNADFVLAQAAPFAADPAADRLIRLRSGETVGEWRDSEEGLGGGVHPYNVNAVFVPAALRSIARLLDSGLLDPAGGDRAAAAARMARIWADRAPELFRVEVPAERARSAVRDYAADIGVDPAPALAALPDGPVRFNAVSLDAAGRPVEVLNSDDGFALLFLDPPAAAVEMSVRALMRPFPAGLLTGAGLLVANAAYADSRLRPDFSNRRYHGAVIWSWQQALLAAGLARQLRRDDLPDATRDLLRTAQDRLWSVIDAGREVRSSELWSWSFADGRYRVEPFGQRGGDQTESNAAQLWSTVHLAVQPPDRERNGGGARPPPRE